MNFSFVFGNFIGRVLVSCVVVWLVCWAVSRFNWRLALKRSSRWYSLLAMLLLALLGMAVPLSRGGA